MKRDTRNVLFVLAGAALFWLVVIVILAFAMRAAMADELCVSWRPNPPADSVLFYHVYGVTGADTTLIATVPAPDTAWVTGQVPAGDLHRYLVRAQNRFGYRGAGGSA